MKMADLLPAPGQVARTPAPGRRPPGLSARTGTAPKQSGAAGADLTVDHLS
ncbi:hypothetical protein KCH_71300 [Kitasatospora cheerisanensis KCTC 2395]|uniref:Uncharacterized protein n=1 Tax=Kitasatospora cheerisanensis KCTC 2395 TaxID=1348663 RepID=A0A066YSH3_9ACTN|nr:hypothetical protein KCH_71300 [Kitasatospora cheerisanensis KCTC 2395]